MLKYTVGNVEPSLGVRGFLQEGGTQLHQWLQCKQLKIKIKIIKITNESVKYMKNTACLLVLHCQHYTTLLHCFIQGFRTSNVQHTVDKRIPPIIAHQSKIKIKVVISNIKRLCNLNIILTELFLKAILRSNLGRASLEQPEFHCFIQLPAHH